MLRIELIAVGTKPPSWVTEGVDQYSARMQRECKFEIREVKTSDRKKNLLVEAHQAEEARLIEQQTDVGARVVALDRTGANWSTEQLASNLAAWSQQTHHFQFIIGGPDGLSASLLKKVDSIWSLSNLTFPHFLVRVLLAEQLYRALMLNANHPYHK